MAPVALQLSGKRSPIVVYGTGAAVVLVAVAAYLFFFSAPSGTPVLTTPPAREQVADPTDTQLRNLRFNVGVLQDARFKALRIFGAIPVAVQKPPYRPNPFTR